jgi:transposase
MTSEKARTRRRYGAQFKAQVLAECEAPGASVARVAMSHGINDNVVHRWRQLAREAGVAAAPVAPTFVPLVLPTPAEPRADIRIELRRGATSIAVTWPIAAAAEFGIWMRELLR